MLTLRMRFTGCNTHKNLGKQTPRILGVSLVSPQYLVGWGRVVRGELDGRDVQFEPRRFLPLQAAVPAARLLHAWYSSVTPAG